MDRRFILSLFLLLVLLFAFLYLKPQVASPPTPSTTVEVSCKNIVKEFSPFSDLLKRIPYSKFNFSCPLEVPIPLPSYFQGNQTLDIFESIEFIYNLTSNSGFHSNTNNLKTYHHANISWAFATAEQIRLTRSQIKGSKFISVKKIALVLLYLFQNQKVALKRTPQEICPLFRIRCPEIVAFDYGECPYYFPRCFLYRLIGNDFWRKQKTVIDQAKEALDRGRVLYGMFETTEDDKKEEIAVVIWNYFLGANGNIEASFRNFGELRSLAFSGHMDIRSFRKIYDGFFVEKELIAGEKESKSKYDI